MMEKIRNYIVENLLDGEVEVTDDTPLYSSGLITSMGHLKLINYIERAFEISISAGKINLENFDSINQIVRFIQEEQK